ncbi:MAG: alternative ribosome rescue aminoacyl-tRNA hydrolase ArfB [Flavobacteriaceae bacterium]|nr:alternative ribosome rescue aminoacyl-tRNA hydrolase ArfB [Flavobacteriaceae bacterium]MDH3795455.1 alternative ribosome rescue aminoacyl-tRNA hydrolase ArfB [Flavobacteriaceae bacterium]
MDREQIHKELIVKFSRSSGPGGQNVNKVATKVITSLHIDSSEGLSSGEKRRIWDKLSNKISKEGYLTVSAEDSRSQSKNRDIAEKKLFALLADALKKPKLRRKTKPSRASKEKRLKKKKAIGEKKQGRKKPDIN